ncbi:LysR family transcriptional regulator [Ruminiclostridium cellulolyticum]|uniref:Transcriptional regulator, LysR family n=1 Tax=Ruminiclostridium cellulolyticum (strain ATCC 35319 / DSM 5812 / JCM 6584 / H10) TaxID=394503 RepID=B8I787_RUMCH|nr:LysR family transcriptional regulator [Ruminiclostridium cellulolyticum]ACL75011.1 transcriptional regulator, LysR family [Ruminiclostridium cellulolyticum H10]
MIDPKITTFIWAAKLSSYTRAAEMLNLTQPAVTQHIKQLEEHYKVKLFKKVGRQICLTEEGELLFKYAKEFEASSLFIERTLRNKSAVNKHYNIGTTLTIGEFVLPGILGQYKKQHDNIDIIIHVHNTDENLKRLTNGELDLSIVEGPFDKNKYKHKKMRNDELVLVASPASSLAKKGAVIMEDIAFGGKLILREKGSGTRMILENKITEMGLSLSDLKVYMEVGSIGAIKSLVQANLGYTLVSMEAVRREVRDGTLVVVPITGVRIMREFNFIYTDMSQNSFIEEFINYIMSFRESVV